MSRRDAKLKGRGNNLPPFTPFFKYVTRSAAFEAMTRNDLCVYFMLKDRYLPGNNGQIPISTREVSKRWGMSKDSANDAIRHLVELGFIVVETPSGFNRKDRTAPLYRLTEYRDDLPGRAVLPSKEFMKWMSEEKSTVPNQIATVPVEGQQRRKPTAKPVYGPSTGTVKPKAAPRTVPDEGHYIDIPRGEGLEARAPAEVETAPAPEEARERRGRTHTTRDAPAPSPSFQRSSDGPVKISETLATILKGLPGSPSIPEQDSAATGADLSAGERTFLHWLVGFDGEASHRKAQQNLSGQMKGGAIKDAAIGLERRKLIQIENEGRSVIYSLLAAGRNPSLLKDPNQIDLVNWLEQA